MAQAIAMHGALVAGSIDTLRVSTQYTPVKAAARLPALSVGASLNRDALAVAAPAVVVLADAGAANALTAEDVTGTFLKVRIILSE